MNDSASVGAPGAAIGERLARLETGQEWIKIILGLIGAVLIGGFAFLGIQIKRLDAKFDSLSGRIDGRIASLGSRISAENAATRQELIGVATAISNSITAARQFQPQILPMPNLPGPSQPPAKP